MAVPKISSNKTLQFSKSTILYRLLSVKGHSFLSFTACLLGQRKVKRGKLCTAEQSAAGGCRTVDSVVNSCRFDSPQE